MRHGLRLGILGSLLVGVGGCAAGPSPKAKTADNGPARRCSVGRCFNQRDIRSYDVLDDHTLVVYTGGHRCPFLVTVRGPHCSMGLGPSLAFLSPRRENPAANATIPRILSGAEPIPAGQSGYAGNPFSPAQSRYGLAPAAGQYFDKPSRICSMAPNTIAYTGAMPVGRETPVDAIPGLNYACVLDQVHSMTDNQLIELYVKRKLVPPPPPVGQGSLSVPKTPPASASGDGNGTSGAGAPGGASGNAAGSTGPAAGEGGAPPDSGRNEAAAPPPAH